MTRTSKVGAPWKSLAVTEAMRHSLWPISYPSDAVPRCQVHFVDSPGIRPLRINIRKVLKHSELLSAARNRFGPKLGSLYTIINEILHDRGLSNLAGVHPTSELARIFHTKC